MDRLKTFGKWIIIIIAFYIFSSIIMKINLNNMKKENIKNSNNIQNVQGENN